MSENESGVSLESGLNGPGVAADEQPHTEGGRLSRRHILQLVSAAAGIGVATSAGFTIGEARSSAASAQTSGRTGTIADLKHVVIVMQENRSYDHYFGTLDLPGSRGFGDKQVLTWQNGNTNYYEPNSRPEGYLLPYHADSTKYNAQNTSSRPWYFEQQDIPWQHALAQAYTVADHYFCALNTSTDPNRIMHWSGTNDPDGTLGGGPRINNNNNGEFLFKWKTYPEVLQDAGVTWKMYVNNNPDTGWLGDFEDNLLRDFARYNPATASAADKATGGLLDRGAIVVPYEPIPAGVTSDVTALDYVLQDFINDCAAGALPEVSWVTSPAAWSEHPNNAPNHGAMYCDRVIQAVHENPELWDSTLIVVTFDEPNGANRIGDGGFFDHVTPPIPEVGTAGERAPGLWAGFGGRIPVTLVSPWTRGGFVVSEVFNHTSTIQFLEKWTTFLGKPSICENISAWRRSVSGDLMSAIDFSQFDNSFPELPARDGLHAAVVADAALPAVPQPAVGAQVLPAQPTSGPLKVRPLPYQSHGVLAEDRAAGKVTVNLSYEGGDAGKAVSLVGLADNYLPRLVGAEPLGLGQDALPMTVDNQKGNSYTWDATQTDGKYALSFYGPDHFVRSFAGQLVPPEEHDAKIPVVTAELVKGKSGNGSVVFTLAATGHRDVRFEFTRNDFLGRDTAIEVAAGKSKTFTWPTEEGYYDVIITADTGTGWTQRYAGRVAQV